MAEQETTHTIIDEEILTLIERIYASRAISAEEKERYIQDLQNNGLTENFLGELETIFAKDEELLRKDIGEKEDFLKSLDDEIAQEDTETDRPQAEMLVAFKEVADDDVKAVKEELDQFDGDLAIVVEESGKKSETSEIEKIRASLKKK